jgi:hypothetical protein
LNLSGLVSEGRGTESYHHSMPKLEIIEDEIARQLAEAAKSGELKSAPSYGKPLAMNDGWDDTPQEFRMAFKALKDAGFVPPEIEAFHERAHLQERLRACEEDSEEQKQLASELAALDQRISLRLEGMRVHGSI